MKNDDLREVITEFVDCELPEDKEILDRIILLEGDEFADGAVGLTDDYHMVYSYNKLVESLSRAWECPEEEAMEWLDYNTLRSLPYMESQGNAPIILTMEF